MTQEAEANIKEYMQEICERTDKDDTDVVLCIREHLSEHPNAKVSEMLEELLMDRRKIKEERRARAEATTAQILEPFRVITDEYERIAG